MLRALRSLAIVLTLPIAAALAAACTESSVAPPEPGPDPSTHVDAGTDAQATAAIAWSKCPLHTEGGSPSAECATVALPLRASEGSGETIDVFVKRYRPKGGAAKRALWMLQGGPGGSGYVFEGIAKAIATKYPDIEFYMPDHRGTGKSTKLTCAGQSLESEGSIGIASSEWPACLAENQEKWGDKLAAFSTTNAANDVELLIERTRREGQPVFIYGVSYGTYWANRYLQLFPRGVDGVVMDSIAGPGSSLARQDEDANVAARDLFAVCAKDPVCASKLGADPWAKALAVVTKLRAGHCADLVPPSGFARHEALRLAFGQMLMTPHLRGFIPAAIHRVDRCGASDVTALTALFFAIFGDGSEGGEIPEFLKGFGFVLSYNIAFSELWESPAPTSETLAAIRDGAVASREITAGMPEVFDIWPRYQEPLAAAWATTDVPLLMLAGGLDPATLLRKQYPARDHFRGTHQHFVEIPSATHTVISSSTTSAKRSCGTMIMMSFLENPTSAPDQSCLADVLPVSFDGDAALTDALFGTENRWD